ELWRRAACQPRLVRALFVGGTSPRSAAAAVGPWPVVIVIAVARLAAKTAHQSSCQRLFSPLHLTVGKSANPAKSAGPGADAAIGKTSGDLSPRRRLYLHLRLPICAGQVHKPKHLVR